MKQSITIGLNRCLFLLSAMLVSIMSFAQDSAVSATTHTTTTTTTQTWYAQPWVWVVGGVVLLVLIIALVSSSGNRTEKTTVINRTSDR